MRRNPLLEPLDAFLTARAEFETSAEEHQRSFYKSLNRIKYSDEEIEDYTVRNMLKYLAQWAAYTKIIEFVDEAIELLTPCPCCKRDEADSIDEILVALKERLDQMLKNPPVKEIKKIFEEFQKTIGISFEGFRFGKARYVDEYLDPSDQFVYDYLHYFTFSYLYFTVVDFLAAVRSGDDFVYRKDDRGSQLINLRHQRMAEELTEEQLANIRDDINSVITGRTYYGFRDTFEIDNIDATKIMWSNGSASWGIASGFYLSNLKNIHVYNEPAKSGFMDTNIIIVPYPEPVVRQVLSSLYPLPMYSYSMEGRAKQRAAGKDIDFVSDREAKKIIRGLAILQEEAFHRKYYAEAAKPVDPNSPSVKWRADAMWNKVLEAKAKRDLEVFREIFEDIETSPIIAIKLANWFDSSQI
jgi:hypothetical protein